MLELKRKRFDADNDDDDDEDNGDDDDNDDGACKRQRSARGGSAHSCGHCGEMLWVPTTKPGGAQLLYFYTFVLLYFCVSLFLYFCGFQLLYLSCAQEMLQVPTFLPDQGAQVVCFQIYIRISVFLYVCTFVCVCMHENSLVANEGKGVEEGRGRRPRGRGL